MMMGFAISKRVIVLALIIAFVHLASSFIAYHVGFESAANLLMDTFIPWWLTYYLLGLFQPGYDDIQYGECIFPYCDVAAGILSFLISLMIYSLLAWILLRLYSLPNGKNRN